MQAAQIRTIRILRVTIFVYVEPLAVFCTVLIAVD